ncbi:MAG: Re/Si-specific NAD(P)(+) transhydrogenase subunit alpha [Candidatus Omnitrophica bacterium]|nr:Re/Si-specific NAD(P)(+) transhydrogenase subunit alpha [Candidatus Omnitrophota bacterium]MCA9415316.1 Re/Si-specific NAD(P)(+) transhydrogenase subunit alpha [Candidatus Omnitrophota bacterium]
MILGIPKETFPGERRVAIVPTLAKNYQKLGLDILVETGAGKSAGFPDSEYEKAGFRISPDRATVFQEADVVAQVRGLGANPETGQADLSLFRQGQIQIGFLEPLTEQESISKLKESGVVSLSMEMMPRITRAQSMDALSSMATIAGYKAVLLAADSLHRMFPMLMTAAGTVSPARVFVVGVGVAGLQAIATAKRLGAVVSAYDIRPAVKEQVQSVGAKFIEMELEAEGSEDKGGYAKEMNEEFYRKQRELMIEVLRESDVVITTAAVPGKKAPILVTMEMVQVMAPGSLVIDLAAERGGNCELTVPGEDVDHEGVTIMGPVNLPSTIPYHASQMYAKNLCTFLTHLTKEKEVVIDPQDEITRETLITQGGEIVHPRVREVYGLPPLQPVEKEASNPEGENSGS